VRARSVKQYLAFGARPSKICELVAPKLTLKGPVPVKSRLIGALALFRIYMSKYMLGSASQCPFVFRQLNLIEVDERTAALTLLACRAFHRMKLPLLSLRLPAPAPLLHKK
jgi:hypothetical protein